MSPAERVRFDRLLERDATLREEWASLREMRAVLERTAVDGFGPRFSTRVVARLRRRRLAKCEASPAPALASFFRPLASITVAAAAILMVLNFSNPALADAGASAMEQAFGMPVATVEAAEVLYLE